MASIRREVRFSPTAINALHEIDEQRKKLGKKKMLLPSSATIITHIGDMRRLPIEMFLKLSTRVGYKTDLRFERCGNKVIFFRADDRTISVMDILDSNVDYVKIALMV